MQDDIEATTCDKCRERVHPTDLIWLNSEDFKPLPDEIVDPSAFKKYEAVCNNCYGDIITLKEKTSAN